jgi:hypothetical protein
MPLLTPQTPTNRHWHIREGPHNWHDTFPAAPKLQNACKAANTFIIEPSTKSRSFTAATYTARTATALTFSTKGWAVTHPSLQSAPDGPLHVIRSYLFVCDASPLPCVLSGSVHHQAPSS